MKNILLFLTLLAVGSLWLPVFVQSPQTTQAGDILYETILSHGEEAAVEQYREWKSADNSEYDLEENTLKLLAYRLLDEARYASAVAMFRLNTEYYPRSVDAWDSLGEGLLAMGKNEEAIAQYRKALDMLESATGMSQQVRGFYQRNAQNRIFVAENLGGRAVSDLHYVSIHGGIEPGRWEMRNLVGFKEQSGLKISHSKVSLYASPVPNIAPHFTGSGAADVHTSFISGDYRRFVESGKIAEISGLWSQESNIKANDRVVAHSGVDQSLYSDVQKRIVAHVNKTEVLVPLFEMNTRPEFARQALTIFQEFWANPEDVDGTLQKLETARREVFDY